MENGAVTIVRTNLEVQKEETVVDLGALSRFLPNPLNLLFLRPSMDQRYVAFILEAGEENRKILYVKDFLEDICCQINLPPESGNVCAFEWGCATDSKLQAQLLFIVTDFDYIRPQSVYLLDVSRVPLIRERCHLPQMWRYSTAYVTAADFNLVFREADPAFFVSVSRSPDNKYIIVHSHSKMSSEALIIDETKSSRRLKLFRKRMPNVRYFLSHYKDSFYISSNASVDGSADLKLYSCKPKESALVSLDESAEISNGSDWIRVWPLNLPQPPAGAVALNASNINGDFYVEDMDFAGKKAVLYGRRNGSSSISIVNLQNGDETHLSSEIQKLTRCPHFQITPAANENHGDKTVLKFSISSPLLAGKYSHYNRYDRHIYR
jgi:hypothetical protein